MQRHEAGLVELGFADTKAGWRHVQDDIDQLPSEGFASRETGTGEQAEDGLEGKRQERTFLPGSSRGMEDRLDFSGREEERLRTGVAGEETQFGNLRAGDRGTQ